MISDMEHYLRMRDFVKMGKRVLYVNYRLRIHSIRGIQLDQDQKVFKPSRAAGVAVLPLNQVQGAFFSFKTSGAALVLL
jgi:hypothetical protein